MMLMQVTARLAASFLGSLLLCLAAAGLCSVALSQQKPEAPVVRCNKCKNTGRLACKQHSKSECPLEDQVLYCSVVADCQLCFGAGFIDCPKCVNAPVEAELEVKREITSERKPTLAWIDETWNKGRTVQDSLRKTETEHFVLVWEMQGLKIDKKRRNEHETMHIYAMRLEQLYGDYLAALQASPREWKEKSVILVWYLPNDQMESSLRFCSQGSRGGVRLLGLTPRFSVCGNKQFFNDDEALHRGLMHNATHLLLSHQKPSAWIGNKKYGWADEGFAHWFEDRYFDKCTNYCYQEQNANVDFKGGRYKLAVRKMVAMDEQPPVGSVFSRTTDELKLAEHAVAFSYVDYLLHLDGKKFDELVKRLKADDTTRDALKRVYGMNPLQFEERWKAWVLETYPTR